MDRAVRGGIAGPLKTKKQVHMCIRYNVGAVVFV